MPRKKTSKKNVAESKPEEEITRLGNYVTKRVMVSREDLMAGIFFSEGNWRTEKDYIRLSPTRWKSLKQIGQETALWVRKHPDHPGKLEIIRGHSRKRGFEYGITEVGNEEFDKLFPEGIAVDVFEGITERIVALLKQDNANSEDMRKGKEGILDWTRSGLTMIRAGCSRDEIALTLEAQTEKLWPKEKDKGNGKEVVKIDVKLIKIAEELGELAEQIVETRQELKKDGASKKTVNLAVTGLDRAVKDRQTLVEELNTRHDELIVAIRKGTTDRLTNHWNGGPYLDFLLYQSTYGERDPDCPESLRLKGMVYRVKGENGVVDKVAKAARTDASRPSGFLTVTQREKVPYGAEFQAVWKKLREKADDDQTDQESDESDGPALKVMSAKSMLEMGRRRQSNAFKLITQALAGAIKRDSDEVKEQLETIDGLLQVAETVRDGDPEFWRTQVVSRFMSLQKKAVEAAGAAVEPEKKEAVKA